MTSIMVRCTCGQVFEYTIDNLEKLTKEWASSGVMPLIIPHGDHFVTAYLDKQGIVRSVEKVILVNNQKSSNVVEILPEGEVLELVREIRKEYNPSKQYYKFVSSLLQKTNSPESLFKAGQLVGLRMWNKKRESILKLGAKYILKVELLMKSELLSILEMTGETELKGENTLKISRCIAPQFIVGLAQGIIDAILKASGDLVEIKIEYEISGDIVSLKLLKTI